MSSLARYFHTLRHLRPVQIAGRLRHRLHRPSADLRAPPPRRAWRGTWAAPIAPPASMVGARRFRLLGVEAECADAADWNDPRRTALWTYNLHYFDDLNAQASASRAEWHQDAVARWMAQNPPGRGVGWDAYPLSRRLINWIKWSQSGATTPPGFDASVAVQARWLTQRLEYHLLGNHLLANAKALVFAGLYFDGAEAASLLATGMSILDRELREQVLADGAHFELSTMYHAATLEDLLDLVNITQAAGMPVPDAWLDAARRMQRWLDLLTHPDGGISFFNDAAFGIAPDAAALRDYAARLGHGVPVTRSGALEWLADSGYARLGNARACLLARAGAIGPDYLPGHAHADSLSFELSLGEQRLLVNSGTSEYGISAERNRQRGTAAHNTVTVNGADSSEVWAGFRVARRARSRRLAAAAAPAPMLEAEHDGFRRLPGRNLHRRRWTLEEGQLRIDDEVTGAFTSAEACFHLHPGVQASEVSPGCFALRLPGGAQPRMEFDRASVTLQPSTWHPRFGESVPNQRLVARFAGTLCTRVVFG